MIIIQTHSANYQRNISESEQRTVKSSKKRSKSPALELSWLAKQSNEDHIAELLALKQKGEISPRQEVTL